MMNKSDIKIGQTVYIQEHWTKGIFEGTVTEILDEGVRVDAGYFVDSNGKPTHIFGGDTGGMFEDVYPTAKDAYDGINAKYDAQVKAYCEEITDANSLAAFPLKHPFGAEEYTNCAAIEAYKIRCKELLGLDLSEL